MKQLSSFRQLSVGHDAAATNALEAPLNLILPHHQPYDDWLRNNAFLGCLQSLKEGLMEIEYLGFSLGTIAGIFYAILFLFSGMWHRRMATMVGSEPCASLPTRGLREELAVELTWNLRATS
jgi:hypothetical protein